MPFIDKDDTATQRKEDHIQLAFQSQTKAIHLDKRFDYEPLLAAHPSTQNKDKFIFLGKKISVPLWVSSMTGGTAYAKIINANLARAAAEFGFGMGLGSCRSLLTSEEYLADFDVRHLLGDDLPLYANLGIAQLEQLLDSQKLDLITKLLEKLQADGLIIHINPLQEWLQPEGDKFLYPPIDTLRRLIEQLPKLKIIVKEVGQGMGYQSLKALFQLPIEAIDFAANGGTNFAQLELLRSNAQKQKNYQKLVHIGHSAGQMVDYSNQIINELGSKCRCKQVIISGGIKDFLDGYYFINKIQTSAIYGQASAFLEYARGDYETLQQYIYTQIEGLKLAQNYLHIKE